MHGFSRNTPAILAVSEFHKAFRPVLDTFGLAYAVEFLLTVRAHEAALSEIKGQTELPDGAQAVSLRIVDGVSRIYVIQIRGFAPEIREHGHTQIEAHPAPGEKLQTISDGERRMLRLPPALTLISPHGPAPA